MMQFEWDDAKAASNLAKHGIGFETAAAALLTGQYVARQDGRVDYGENPLGGDSADADGPPRDCLHRAGR